jgi:hypothetical protein
MKYTNKHPVAPTHSQDLSAPFSVHCDVCPRIQDEGTQRKLATAEARYRTTDIRKTRANAIARRLACYVTWKLSFSVVPRVAWSFLQFELLHSVTCSTQADNDSRKLQLHCGCQFPWFAFSPRPSHWNRFLVRQPQTKGGSFLLTWCTCCAS